MKRVMAGLAALVISFASGCAFEGRITRKIHEPAESVIKVYRLALYDGKNLAFSRVPVLCEDDEDFVVYVFDEVNQAERKFYLRDPSAFDSLKEGDRFRYDSKIAKEEDAVKKRRITLEEYRRLKND